MERAFEFIKEKLNLKYNDTVVVAVSGGPDSMALLHVLVELRSEYNLFIVCAHVHHNVRKESDLEKEYIEKHCDNLGVQFETIKLKQIHDDNFHNQARTKRYSFFEKLMHKYNARYLFTAHHGDDLIETVLMRIVRGSTLGGYSGFSKILKMGSYSIVRPFISLTKKDILEYNKNRGIKYFKDASNKKEIYTRNRYRKYMLPFLKEEDPKVNLKFLKFSETLQEYNNYIDKLIKTVINEVYAQNVLNVEKFLRLDKLIQTKILYHIFEMIYQDDLMLINDHHTDILFNLINSKKPNIEIHLPNNIRATKAYNQVTLYRASKELREYEYIFDSYINLPNGKNIEICEDNNLVSNFILRINSNDIKLPLKIRTRKDGDKMTIKGSLGKKKVKDVFIDCKIPLSQRNLWPLVVDYEDNIIWIPGLKKSKIDKSKNEKYDIIIKYY